MPDLRGPPEVDDLNVDGEILSPVPLDAGLDNR